MTTTRIAVVGGGIAGLTTASILGRAASRYRVHVFERAPKIRDEGYGLDFDKTGQEVLQLAGVYDKFWEFSRPRSDVMKFYLANQDKPFGIRYNPNILKRWFPGYFHPYPESNRAAFRNVMLEEIKKQNVPMTFECKVSEVRETANGVELLTESGESLGFFDMILDTSGVHSVLRKFRVDDPVGKHYSKRMMVHGVVTDPESSCPRSIVDKLEEGTFLAFAKGYTFGLQRFGADTEDRRTSFFYHVAREDPNELFVEMDIPQSVSREHGIVRDEENLKKIKSWIHKDMGDVFNKDYHDVVDALDRLTVRPEFTHGKTETTLKKDPPRVICIGDALLNIGLGGGANFACEEVKELTSLLNETEYVDWSAIRLAEEGMLKRRREFFGTQKRLHGSVLQRTEDKKDALKFSWQFRTATSITSLLCNTIYEWDQKNGGTGSVPEKKEQVTE